MTKPDIKNLGELKANNYHSKSIKDELRANLLKNIKTDTDSFEGIYGYENSVIPQIERAILSKHNINLLGLRGQAKTKIARQMVNLLDEWIPVVEGSEVNDDPFAPISHYAKTLIDEKGDDTPVTFLHRSNRFAEKLATPDVSVADLIGDIDPIKAANQKLSYSDERVLHFGMIPRANRSLFVINELPDLQARIQVSLFNILQEGDVQIRGFQLRMLLDIQFIFTANPEDYTNRGSIVTPLKDRLGSQILTHYPDDIKTAKTITQSEAKKQEDLSVDIYMPEVAKDLLEQISFEARDNEYVDVNSGVSARLSISAYENLMSTVERRTIANGDTKTQVRLTDFTGTIPAIIGKIELLYEGEQSGADQVAMMLLDEAIKSTFVKYFPDIKKLEKKDEKKPYDDIIAWFYEGNEIEILDNASDDEYKASLLKPESLEKVLNEHQPELDENDRFFFMELVLWSLTAYKKLSKQRFSNGYQFKDSLGSYIQGL